MWFVLALLSAIFAALTSILAKVGIDGVNSNLATAIRTVVVMAMAWGMVFLTNAQSGITEISRKSWVFLILSGLATGASWLCYYKALQVGDASKVVPIVINIHPIKDFKVNSSCKNTNAKTNVITTLNLSTGTTFDASPTCKAL